MLWHDRPTTQTQAAGSVGVSHFTGGALNHLPKVTQVGETAFKYGVCGLAM